MLERFVPVIRRQGSEVSPDRRAVSFDDLVETMVERFFGDPVFGPAPREGGMVVPSMDLKENDEAVIVTAELRALIPPRWT